MNTPGIFRLAILSGWTVGLLLTAERGEGWDFQATCQVARETATHAYQPDKPLSQNLQGLTYDELRDIRFSPQAAVWQAEKLPFQLQFFHPGGLQKDRITVSRVEGDAVLPILFSKEMFDYRDVRIPGGISDDAGFSGFRIHNPLNRPDYFDELIVFQGASYFRALAQGCIYGISARGLGLDIGAMGEEFPRFRNFWVEKPDRTTAQLRIWALLDSSCVVGAYEFVVNPGKETVIDVKASLFFRKETSNLSLAPLTSMFWYGENSPHRFGDFRPEVHDSDGALIQKESGEWIWRPLVNDTNRWRHAVFAGNNPKGFGLFQRDRDFHSYEDLEALYQLRPSLWIEPPPQGWGEGEIRLIEFSTHVEYGDNMCLFWVPRTAGRPGVSMDYSYRMRWITDSPQLPPLGRVQSTRLTNISYNSKAKRFILDFTVLPVGLTPGDIKVDVTAERGRVLGSFVQKNDYANTWRAFFDVEAEKPNQVVELRCLLRTEKETLTETWTYQWTL